LYHFGFGSHCGGILVSGHSWHSGMGSSSREDIVEVFDALDADLDGLCALSFGALTIPERLRLSQRVERVARWLRVGQTGRPGGLQPRGRDAGFR
jgi:hypothetical protein